MTKPEYITAYDDKGNEIQVLSKESAEALIAEKETTIQEGVEKITKLEEKGFNFAALKTATKEQRVELLSKLSNTEKLLVEQQEQHQKDLESFRSERVTGFKVDAITALVGQDKELIKKIQENYEKIIGPANTKEEVQQRVRDAHNMIGAPSVTNPIADASRTTSLGDVIVKRPASELSQEQKEFGKKFGISDEKLQNYGKPKGKGK